jgi:ring-1,2-phenylacetyl-CoA epoxidase subunit PaaC
LARDDALSDATLAAIAAKSEKESAYHVAIPRNGSSASATAPRKATARAQSAIDELWAFTGEMFAVDDSERG